MLCTCAGSGRLKPALRAGLRSVWAADIASVVNRWLDCTSLGTGNQSPVAQCVSLEDCRMQSERLWRDAANPKLHALGLDLNEGGVRSVLLARKIHIIGGLPAPVYLRRALAQRSSPDQCNVGVVGVVLKDDRHLASAPDVGRLSRSAIGEECEESDRPVVLVGTPHWPRAGAAVLGRGRQPAIARACDGLGRAGEQPAHFDLIALVFRSGHRRASINNTAVAVHALS